ncbi:membrane protein [Pseudomonas sp. BAY1663]|uniref:sulfite exporter TauE/SafE family protein n=1 Tax=Pseudomonadaceae TaxID=135621 RepID=UPI00042DFFC9|nr:MULTISPECIES: sulfite exporter TauE/SafE family protein [Pseudomonadaceae]EXF42798.1 membrane protein [Pseudomonas sp. BAY1663]MCQ4327570.1 sulfite exporter TauE/SafE family protein [Stutzerimonas stutzeri]
MLLESLYGVGVGLALGLTGGGGVLAVPALVLGLGYSLPEATPVALVAVGASALLGGLDGLRRGLVRYRAALLMAGGGALCAPLGLLLAQVLPVAVLMLLFCAVLLLIAARMVGQALARTVAQGTSAVSCKSCRLDSTTGRFRWTPRCFLSLSLIGGLSGLFSGLLGVGGGFLIVPGIRQVSDLGMHGIVATSLLVIALISAGTVIGFWWAGGSLPSAAWTFIAAAGGGMLGGRLLAPRVSARALQLGFALLAGLAALMLLGKALASLPPLS